MEGKKSNRKNLRLKNFDYSSNGAYFITICTHQMEQTLCSIVCRGDPCGLPRTKLTELGKLAEKTICEIEKDPDLFVGKYVVMPNHLHMIIRIAAPLTDRGEPCHYSISRSIGIYKSLVAHKWLAVCNERNIRMGKIWQRSFHDHIIRCEQDYLEIWKYIDENPLKWEFDKYYK